VLLPLVAVPAFFLLFFGLSTMAESDAEKASSSLYMAHRKWAVHRVLALVSVFAIMVVLGEHEAPVFSGCYAGFAPACTFAAWWYFLPIKMGLLRWTLSVVASSVVAGTGWVT
jgi:hypothetical protein